MLPWHMLHHLAPPDAPGHGAPPARSPSSAAGPVGDASDGGALQSALLSPAATDGTRDPARLLQVVRHQWRAQGAGAPGDLWVFAYASLIWRPEFEFIEHRRAVVAGWHRALRMRSRINRGTPEQPGLVYALVSGGTCQGMVFRIDHQRAEAELDRLWQREMVTGVYSPRWLRCQTPDGPVAALGFTLSRRSPSFTGRLSDADMVHILRHAQGRFGTTLDYLVRTEQALRQHGMADAESRRLVQLARAQGLL